MRLISKLYVQSFIRDARKIINMFLEIPIKFRRASNMNKIMANK